VSNAVSSSSTTLNSATAARAFLKALGAPTTPGMVRAVQAWLRAEGSTIIGNNPWNLHSGAPCHSASHYCPNNGGNLPGQIGNRYAGKGDQNVAVFSSLDAGATASAKNLLSHGNDWTGYGRVVTAARSGDPTAFLNALARSAWSSGRYKIDPKKPAGGSNNRLIALFNGTSALGVGVGVSGGLDTGGGIDATLTSANLTTDAITLLKKAGITDLSPTHAFSAEEAAKIASILYGQDPNSDIGKATVKYFTGKTVQWFIDQSVTTGHNAPDPLTSLANSIGNIGKYWQEGLAIVVGVPIALLGFYMLVNTPGVEASS